MATPLLVSFIAGDRGPWRIVASAAVIGDALPAAARLTMAEAPVEDRPSVWTLRGITSNHRYTSRDEALALRARQQGLGRTEARCAALIPIRKSAAWWDLAQDERRAIMEERSRHIAIGLDYLPAVARRLHHCRDLGLSAAGEPFDFLTWFEYAPEAAADFERLVERLRATEEWRFVEREVDVRLMRDT
ncbi:MAG: chlorite dismutase family protein [Bradyrhizobium sp.]|nr:chlorite dismutase family protein [Bradyrhizobium sp.]